MRDPNSLGRFSAGPSNDMSGNLRFLILNRFLMFVEFHFYFILIFLSFRKYPDFERKGKNTIVIWFVFGEIGWKYYWVQSAPTLFADGNPIIGINNKSLVSQYQQLEAKLRKLEESVVCCICVERKKDIIFRCGHGACQFCVKQLSVCHICQKPIEMKIQTFWLCVVPQQQCTQSTLSIDTPRKLVRWTTTAEWNQSFSVFCSI